jgi:ATP-binding cassette subfamily B protein
MPRVVTERATVEQPRRAQPDGDRLLFRTALRGGKWLPLLLTTAAVLAAASVALPALIGRATDAVLGRGSDTWLLWLSVVIVVMVACDALEDLAAGATTAESTAWLRRLIFRHVLSIGPSAVERFGPGDLAGRVTGNAADAGRVAPDVVRAAANALPSAGGIVALGLIDPWLCLTFLAGLPILAFLVRVFARRSFEVAGRYLTAQAAIASSLVDALAGSRSIAAAGTVDREVSRVLRGLPDLHRHGVEMWRTQIRMATQDGVIVSLLEVAVLAVAGTELARGRISPGELLAAAQYVVLASNLGHASSFFGRMGRDRAASQRATAVLEVVPRAYGTRRLPPGNGLLEFRDVTVRVDGRSLLDNVDMSLPGGSLVAVVGESGSGKSVFGAVAGRLTDPDEGDVLLDGVPLRALAHRDLRRAVTYAFERPNLIGRTLVEAIRFGATRPSLRTVKAAAKSARADDFIRRLPRQYETPLSDTPMSGGERQRVGLARAFAHAGRVLILDDVAASLDTVTEHEITTALTDELSDRTRIVIAHRASTAARADVVVWLEQGRLRAVGRHHELWQIPAYRALFNAGAEVDTDADDAPANGRVTAMEMA